MNISFSQQMDCVKVFVVFILGRKMEAIIGGKFATGDSLKIFLGSLLETLSKETQKERDWKSAEDYMIHGSRLTVTDYKRCVGMGIGARQAHPLYAIP